MIAEGFAIQGDVKSVAPYGEGHINETSLVITTKGKYILQKISQTAFPDVDMLMRNIDIVTKHLAKKGITSLSIVKTKKGELYLRNESGAYRVYDFVENTVCKQSLSDYKQVEMVGEAFGDLHTSLSDLDASSLGEIIPCFHDTKKRFADFLSAYKEDKLGRLASCKQEAEAILAQKKYYGLIVDGIADGSIPLHVTHNDPKINNVLFDIDSGKVRCIIDLDTVMPGSVLYDFGDAHRSLFIGSHEDDIDLNNVNIDLEIFRSYLRGYYRKAKSFLSTREKELITLAPFLMTIECGMRFLEDYLKGDVYFHIKYKEHNLVRARTQIKLAKLILSKQEEMKAIAKEIFLESGGE